MGTKRTTTTPASAAAVLGRDDGEEHLTTKLRRAFREDYDFVVGLPLGQGAILALALI
jgi:hypothetical protein